MRKWLSKKLEETLQRPSLHFKTEAITKLCEAEVIYYKFHVFQDPKLLLLTLLSLEKSLFAALSAVILFRNPSLVLPKGLNSRIILFREEIGQDVRFLRMLDMGLMLREIRLQRKLSPVEFRRKGRFVICSDAYDLCVLDAGMVEQFLAMTAEFFSELEEM